MLVNFIFGARKMKELPSDGHFLFGRRKQSSAEAEVQCIRGLQSEKSLKLLCSNRVPRSEKGGRIAGPCCGTTAAYEHEFLV